MIDNNVLLKNPLIRPGYYYAKLLYIETEPSDYVFPKIIATLGLHQMYQLAPNNVLSAIIHPTQNSYCHYKNFRHTFFLGKNMDEMRTGIGHWGSVELSTSEFNDVKYSSVKFVYQPIPIMMESWRIGEEENEEWHYQHSVITM